MSAIDNAQMVSDAFVAWVKEKHPEFIKKNKSWRGIFMMPGMVKLFHEYHNELNNKPHLSQGEKTESSDGEEGLANE